jgi:hypothetical protein
MDSQIDWDALFNQVLQEFCAEYRFWWRKKRLTFATVAATPTYDLSAVTTVPAGAGVFVEEITLITRSDSVGTTCEVVPVTDDAAISLYVSDTSTTDKPAAWMPEDTDMQNFQTIRLSPIPNGAYTLTLHFWAMPNPDQDTNDDNIYIVPKFLHHVVQTSLEKEVWRLFKGVQDPKYTTALALYNKKVSAAKIKRSIDGQHVAKFQNTNSEAIRSTS